MTPRLPYDGMWMQSITTYTEFKQAVVEPDFRDFMSDQSNLRKAWHSAGSLFHLADWVYVAHKPTINSKYKFVDDIGRTKFVSSSIEFANSLGQIHPEFQLIRGIANAAKHCELKSVPPGRRTCREWRALLAILTSQLGASSRTPFSSTHFGLPW